MNTKTRVHVYDYYFQVNANNEETLQALRERLDSLIHSYKTHDPLSNDFMVDVIEGHDHLKNGLNEKNHIGHYLNQLDLEKKINHLFHLYESLYAERLFENTV